MFINFCPGARKFRQPEPKVIRCPFCNYEMEIWTDEVKAICTNCKATVFLKQAQICLDWCKYARECVGEELYQKYLENKKLQGSNSKQNE